MINKELIKYIEENVYPIYEKNDKGHNIDHINYVMNRAIKFAQDTDLNLSLIYIIVSYHDIAHHIDKKLHEKLSAEYFMNDTGIKKFIANDEEFKIIYDAIIDHRASLEYIPRSEYGKLISSADRMDELDIPFQRTYEYRVNTEGFSDIEDIIKESFRHLIDKYSSESGYATTKIWYGVEEHDKFIEDLNYYLSDYELFREKFIEVNKIKIIERKK